MALEIEGKIIKQLPEQTGDGQRGPWIKGGFILETFGEYSKNIAFQTWNKINEILKDIAIGSIIKVKFNTESREYMDKWYTDNRAYEISVTGNTAATTHPQPIAEPEIKQPENDDLPF